MAGIARFEEMEAWKTARQLTNLIYELGKEAGSIETLVCRIKFVEQVFLR